MKLQTLTAFTSSQRRAVAAAAGAADPQLLVELLLMLPQPTRTLHALRAGVPDPGSLLLLMLVQQTAQARAGSAHAYVEERALQELFL